MKYLYVLVIGIVVGGMAGCAQTLPPKVIVSDEYSLLGVTSYSLLISSDGAQLDPTLGPNFLDYYLPALESNIRAAMGVCLPEYRYASPDEADLVIDVALEMLHGGNAAARLWIGFGAGRTVSTAYVRVWRDGRLVAEGRTTETTSLVDVWAGNYANDQAIMQDCPRLARRVAEFVASPQVASANAEAAARAREAGIAPTPIMMRHD